MIGSLLCYVCYPLSRYLAARFAGVTERYSPTAEVNGSAVWDGAAITPRTSTLCQLAFMDQCISATSGSGGETKEANPKKQDSTRPGMDEKALVITLNENVGIVSGPLSEDIMTESPDCRVGEIHFLYEVQKVTEGETSSVVVLSPEEALQTQFMCMKTEGSMQESTSPAQEDIQTSAEAASRTEHMPTDIPAMKLSQTAAETECWDEYTFLDTAETNNNVNYLKLALSSTESSTEDSCVAQRGWSLPAGSCQAVGAQSPLWEFPIASYHPLLETAAPLEVTWRVWEFLKEDAAAAETTPISLTFNNASVDFTVMSYNILAQDLLDFHQDLYTHCPLDVLDWNLRCHLLIQEIQKWLPDILCLQEVQENHYNEQLQPVLSQLGYTCVFKRRTGFNSDGCATCYRSSRFIHTAVTQLEFFRPETGLLDRHNVGIVLLLRPLVNQGSKLTESGPPICVANTHLVFNPRRGDVKLAQLAIILAEIDHVIKSCKSNREHCNIILCGDFNSVPHMPLYQLITTGLLFYKGLPSWMVSGQEDLSHWVHSHRLAVPLWPSSLGITNRCQYFTAETDVENPEQKSEGLQYDHSFMLSLRFCPAACVRPQGLELISGVTDGTPDPPRENQSYEERFGHTISHRLDLESVYKYTPGSRSPDVTTLHSQTGAVVDYIFYSPKRTNDYGDSPSGGLKLAGFVPLLSEDVLWSMNGLPNHVFPSDHLSLVAKFQLDLNTNICL